jgi:hypothetical protein
VLVSHSDNPLCVHDGGAETGTWQYEATTGVLTAVALSDANGECGFSHPQAVVRFKKVGTELVMFTKENGVDHEDRLRRLP